MSNTTRTEMLGVPPKCSGRIVVKDEDVAAFVEDGWIVIEPTDLPLAGNVKVPGKEQKKAESLADPLAGKSTEEIRSELEQARLSDEESAAVRAMAEIVSAEEAAKDHELLAKIMRVYTPELKTIAKNYDLDVDLDALGSVAERRDLVANQLGLIEDDTDEDGDGCE